ncbi:lipoprotein [Ramlibacter sp. XY19]|uniref:LPS translocon maturation chaperone LptM n=1 Tax=Ramlibacter paludis TaxID=2908000 RepID=UPI0023D984E3|nr:lipoprotein [Ramlibacter paludis]MCG2591320.1 lipoprotein [Ramlibacter paludis]
MSGVFLLPACVRLRRLALAAAGVVLLSACGQKGPLYMPKGEAASGRATLADILAPSTAVTVPAGPASSVPGTGKASPVREP